MDKTWIKLPRNKSEYLHGCQQFIEFAFRNKSKNYLLPCPCDKCVNACLIGKKDILDHILCDGFLKEYTNWVFHGEEIPTRQTASANEEFQGQRKMEEERQAAREQNLAIMAQLAAMQEKIDKLEKENHGDAHSNNSSRMAILYKRECNYNPNDITDSASSAASHQMQPPNGSVRNTAKKRTYKMDPQTIQTQKEFSNKDLRRIKNQKSAPYMADERDRLVAKQRVNRPEPTATEVQDTSKYIMRSIDRKRSVAEGFILSDEPQDVVGGQKLGPHFVELFVDKVLAPEEPLIRPYGKCECLKDVAGLVTAWPKSLLKKM